MKLFFTFIFCFALQFAHPQPDTLFTINAPENSVLVPLDSNRFVAQLEFSRPPLLLDTTGTGQYYLTYTKPTGKTSRKYFGWLPKQKKHGVVVFCNRQREKYWYWQYGKGDLPEKVMLPPEIDNYLE